MENLVLTGKFDKFVLECEKSHTEFNVNDVQNRLFKGKRVKCTECNSSGIVYNDGGVYRLIDSDDNISLNVI